MERIDPPDIRGIVLNWLIVHGVEVVPPAITGFFSTSIPNAYIFQNQHIRKDGLKPWQARLVNRVLRHYARVYDRICAPYPYYRPFSDIMDVWQSSRKVINSAADFGEGWFLPGEICELAESGVKKVVSLTVFTFISLPMYQDLLARTDEQVHDFIQHRKEEVTRLVLQGLRP